MSTENIIVGVSMLFSMVCFLAAAVHPEGTTTGRLLALGLFFGIAARFVALIL